MKQGNDACKFSIFFCQVHPMTDFTHIMYDSISMYDLQSNFVIAAVITFKISFKFLFCIVIVHVRWYPLNFFGILLDCIL